MQCALTVPAAGDAGTARPCRSCRDNFEILRSVRYYWAPRRPGERLRARSKRSTAMETDKLLQSEVRVINIGLAAFARDLERCKVPVVHVDWSPPRVSDPRIAALLAKLGG
jgi:hypothetical protein